MSFSDFGRPSKPPPSRTKNSAPQHAPSSGNTAGSGTSLGLAQMSESILQYQRNVGILEKIVQSLLSSRTSYANRELDLQYQAQVDVIDQLGAKLRKQLTSSKSQQSNSADRTTWIKLQRDFERVQERAVSLQGSVQKVRAQQAKLSAVQEEAHEAEHDATASYEYQQQLQLQQDRLNEEIMREREEEIRKINRGMHQVNEIYKDLAHIVNSQQEQIDNIESHMEESNVNAQNGLQQVEKANEKFGNQQCVIS